MPSLFLAGGLTACLTFASWDALVLAALSTRVTVTAPASFAVRAFLFAGRTFASSHQIPNAAISTGVAGRPLPP